MIAAPGPIALHGGGEYVSGDEAAMDALIAAAIDAAGAGRPVRVAVVPTAAAGERPELAAAHGRRAFEAAAARAGAAADVDVAMVVDAASARDPAIAARLDAADLVHFPGGDPGRIPTLLAGTRAWSAIRGANERGAVLAGASAGAMALAERLWTRGGPMAGLGVLPGLAVLPHYDEGRAGGWRATVDPGASLTWLGIDEQTLVIGRPGGTWLVAGRGRAHVLPRGAARPSASAAAGEPLDLGIG